MTPREARDQYLIGCDQRRHFVNAQGTLAREIMQREGKLFGVFARAAFISDPTWSGPMVGDTLSELAYEQMWNSSLALLQPLDIVASLNDCRYIDVCGTARPPLHDTFERLLSTLDGWQPK